MLILASQSPRRIQILTEHNFDFKVIKPSWDETKIKTLNWRSYANIQAYFKAKSVLDEDTFSKDDIVLATDTTVVFKNKILGKPETAERCFEMLKELNGKKHKVVSGVAIIHQNKVYSFQVTTDVYFKKNSESEIKKYIELAKPFDKAGGYGIQDKENNLIKKINGDYLNVVGMPEMALYKIGEILKCQVK